jgi:hypothetical protein
MGNCLSDDVARDGHGGDSTDAAPATEAVPLPPVLTRRRKLNGKLLAAGEPAQPPGEQAPAGVVVPISVMTTSKPICMSVSSCIGGLVDSGGTPWDIQDAEVALNIFDTNIPKSPVHAEEVLLGILAETQSATPHPKERLTLATPVAVRGTGQDPRLNRCSDCDPCCGSSALGGSSQQHDSFFGSVGENGRDLSAARQRFSAAAGAYQRSAKANAKNASLLQQKTKINAATAATMMMTGGLPVSSAPSA